MEGECNEPAKVHKKLEGEVVGVKKAHKFEKRLADVYTLLGKTMIKNRDCRRSARGSEVGKEGETSRKKYRNRERDFSRESQPRPKI